MLNGSIHLISGSVFFLDLLLKSVLLSLSSSPVHQTCGMMHQVLSGYTNHEYHEHLASSRLGKHISKNFNVSYGCIYIISVDYWNCSLFSWSFVFIPKTTFSCCCSKGLANNFWDMPWQPRNAESLHLATLRVTRTSTQHHNTKHAKQNNTHTEYHCFICSTCLMEDPYVL